MKKHETRARELKANGKNCSESLYTSFSEDIKLSGNFPAPRSVDGKCGALLTAMQILKEIGHSEKIEEFEKDFIKKFGYSKCIELMTHEHRCNDYVGESAKMLDEILEKLVVK